MAEKFFPGNKVRLYGGPAFERVQPNVGALKHGVTYEVIAVRYGAIYGEQYVRVSFRPNNSKPIPSEWIEAIWFCKADA